MTPITHERLIELGMLVYKQAEETCYAFPKDSYDLDFMFVSFQHGECYVYSCISGEVIPIRKIDTIEQLDNFVYGMTDNWLIELEEDKFIENTY